MEQQSYEKEQPGEQAIRPTHVVTETSLQREQVRMLRRGAVVEYY